MNLLEPRDYEFFQLLWKVCDGTASENQYAELEKRLQGNAIARGDYMHFVAMHLDLASEGDAGRSTILERATAERVAPRDVQPRRSPALRFLSGITIPHRRVLGSITLVALVFYSVFVFLAWNLRTKDDFALRMENAAPGVVKRAEAVATVTDARNCRWDKVNEPITVGQPLESRELILATGLAEITFADGAKVFLEGPARLALASPSRGYLHRGKLMARVPRKAIGFTVETAAATVVDLGTEFGVDVDEQGQTDVHVFQGRVNVLPLVVPRSPSKPIPLVGGEARRLRVDPVTGEVRSTNLTIDTSKFTATPTKKPPSPNSLEQWQQHRDRLRHDSALLAYYDFEAGGDTLPNLVGDKLHGTIHSAGKPPWTQGRWSGKRGLSFGEKFATVSIPADPALQPQGDWSVAVWFRLDAPVDFYTHIVGQGAQSNRLLWMVLLPSGELDEIYTLGKVEHELKSPAPIPVSRWNFAVGVIDSDVLRFYLNGVAIGAATLTTALPALEGEPLMIGRGGKLDSQRTFTGVIDELAILRRALSAQEIAQWYQAGRPK